MELVNKCLRQLEDLKGFLNCLNQEQYKNSLPNLSNASLGQHTRHILEFYSCLLKAEKNNPRICYDNRERNTILETDKEKAGSEMGSIQAALRNRGEDFDLVQEAYGPDDEKQEIRSTFKRELWYVYEHATHHMAILKIGALLMGITEIPDHFGVADSTIAYRNSQPLN